MLLFLVILAGKVKSVLGRDLAIESGGENKCKFYVCTIECPFNGP